MMIHFSEILIQLISKHFHSSGLKLIIDEISGVQKIER